MTIAYTCVLLIILFPYVFTFMAKAGTRYNNHDPRNCLEGLTGWRRRANYVQLNSFEAMPAFGVAVIISQLAHASQHSINILAVVFVIARICYGICYLTDKATMRSLFWFVGLGCVVGLFGIAY
jgi:uncharacterized MAPEG superfamily protein